MLVRCNAESHSYRGDSSSSSSKLVSVSQTCSLFPACPTLTPYPPLRQQLLSHAHLFTPLLLLWNPQTLLGLLSIPEAMRSSDQHISPSASHPAHPVSHHRSHLHRSATPAAQLLLHVHPATPPPPLLHPIACLAFRHRPQENEENQETRRILQSKKLRRKSPFLWIYPQLKN